MKAGWRLVPLGDVCQVIGGGTPPKNIAKYYAGTIPWATVRDMRSEIISETECQITAEAVKASATNIIPGGNVVIATRVGLGKVCLLAQDTAINQDLRGIVPIDPEVLSVRFLFSWLMSVSELIIAEGTGATVQGVKLPFVKSLQIPVPSLAAQQRIVAILNEAFDGIATAKANAEKNLQNARALFESHLESIFTRRDDRWSLEKLGDLATFRNGINFTKSSRGDAVKIVGVRDFQKDFWAPLDNLKTVTTDGVLPESDMLKEHDLLFVRSNGNKELIGRCLLVGPVDARITHSGFTIRARLNGDSVKPEYLCHFLKSNKAKREMIDSGAGANISSLNQTTLAGLVIPLPSVVDQGLIVKKIQAVAAETQRLESIYQQKLAALDELRKSLLNQAFSGAL